MDADKFLYPEHIACRIDSEHLCGVVNARQEMFWERFQILLKRRGRVQYAHTSAVSKGM
ncbi:MAG: hypothetical protein UY82_C0038G0008 [Candidatus Uhrbacteria bacterium GW2011_GWC2_53_7]|uniref:Uncharacterized protein n=1 Tax=Candidatus Uhrbacteria bacterium GW2011_GWC2_53_7 TaxID=1618986 RepID=A0A0G1XWZ3_9BACT|nr:MAG: hypothetical protein UY82_C0038G0008 [Candidatus Uhrbacteria bacterium GW2011_GWC2_53_7]